MRETVELSSLDLRYEGHRLRDAAGKARLLASIAQRGIEEPLQGVDTPGAASAGRLQTLPLPPEAGDRLRALRVAGRGGSRRHPQSDAGFHGQGVWAFWSRPASSSICFDPRHERGGGGPNALAQQRLGLRCGGVCWRG